VVPDEGAALAEVAAQVAAGEAGIGGVMDDHGSVLRGGSNVSVYCFTWGKIWHREGELSNGELLMEISVLADAKFRKGSEVLAR
jgi:hypothetical protein